MSSERILIVDDDPINLKLITSVLQKSGYLVSAVGDGRAVSELCETFRPNFILMDIQLPGVDGLELTKRLKADPANGSLIVVVMTAFTMKGDEQKALGGGCDGYLKKPIDARALPALIEGYFAERRKADDRRPVDVVLAAVAPGSSVGAHKVDEVDEVEVMDFEAFRNRTGDDSELMHELIELYLLEWPRLLQDVRGATLANDGHALATAAHTVKGAVANFSAELAVRAAALLEEMGRNGDLSKAAGACDDLDSQLDRLHSTLTEFDREVIA